MRDRRSYEDPLSFRRIIADFAKLWKSRKMPITTTRSVRIAKIIEQDRMMHVHLIRSGAIGSDP